MVLKHWLFVCALFPQNGHIHITDFGLSKDEVDSDKGATTFCGTPEYLAPEMLINRKTREGYGKAVDWCVPEAPCFLILPRFLVLLSSTRRLVVCLTWRPGRWSLGTLIYEMLTGWPPFYDKNVRKMCDQILRVRSSPLSFLLCVGS